MQEKQRITNSTLITPNSLENKDLLIDQDRIVDIIDKEQIISDDWQTVDGNNHYLFPGMIDVLQHGFLDYLYNDTLPNCVANNSKDLPAFGVTAYLPSISSLPPDKTGKVLTALAKECDLSKKGSRVLGIHSEGPCFSVPGAHNPKNLLNPSIELAQELIDGAMGKLKAVTLAPEMDGSEEFIKKMKKEGVSVHLGHSIAKPELVANFADWGVDAVTHMYDGLPTYPPDNTGVHVMSLTDALIAESNIVLGLICDGIHVHPRLVELLSHLPSDRVFLETDANKYAGKEGATKFEFFPGRICISEKGKACTYNGMLAGSSLTSIEALQNYFKFSKKTLSQVSIATSLMPAKIIGMDDDMGSIDKGKLADFILLEKNTLEISRTYISGQLVYSK